tara:strand:+ start:2365 stop:4965 length:2601 start_codon:yes stop_codon:yes gene_type:complete
MSHTNTARYVQAVITNSGSGYTTAEIIAALPAKYRTYNLSWSNIVLTPAGGLQSIRLYHPNIEIEGDDTAGYSYVTIGHVLPPAAAAQTDAENYGMAVVVSGEAVVGSGSSATQNAEGADAKRIAAALAGEGNPQSKLTSATVPATVGDAFDIDRVGTTVAYTRKDGTNTFGFTVSDGLGGNGLGKVYKEVSSLSDLPLIATNNFKVKVIGDVDSNQDDYYVQFQTDDGGIFGVGSWTECVGPDVHIGLDKTTLPMKLVSTGFDATGVDQFTLSEIDYNNRVAGDANTNKAPSFVDNKIGNMFYYKDRLAFLSNENIILSESGEPFNFYRTSVTSLLDSDRIDVAAASGRVTNLKAAVGFQDSLILFSENSQFALKGGDLLTPKTVSINPITNFDYTSKINPLALGSYIYFPFNRGSSTGMREYTVNASTDTYDAVEITEHVPSYIPSDIISMVGTTSEDMIALLSANEKNALYIYNYFWNNNQKVLSAWSKFTFTGEIRGMEFIESTLFAVITHNGETNLVKVPLESGLKDAAGYVTHLDMRVATTPARIQLASEFTSAWSNDYSVSGGNPLPNQYPDGGGIFLSGVGDIASTSIPDTQTKISGTFNCKFINGSPNGNQLKIKDAGGNTLFSHDITLGQNTFSYTPTASETATSLCLYRSEDTSYGTYQSIGGSSHSISIADISIVAETADGTSSTILLPYTPSDNSVEVYTTDGLKLNCTNVGATVTLPQALPTNKELWAGVSYTMKYTFSEQLFKAKAGNGTSPSNAAKLMIRNGSIYYADSSYFKVKVTPAFRDTYENTFSPDVVGSTSLGSLYLDSGFYRFPVFTKAQDTVISIENDSALPSNFQSAEFESFMHSRSSRYA